MGRSVCDSDGGHACEVPAPAFKVLRARDATEGGCSISESKRLAEGEIFPGFFIAGFECSEHRLADGRRLDLLESTRHAEFAEVDYARTRSLGMNASREGVTWVRAHRKGGQFDFSCALRRLHAARANGAQVIWDLMHFGWPDELDVFAPSFPAAFARYASCFARFYCAEGDGALIVAPINEMSFLAWAGGDVRCMNPYEGARGVELKAQLVVATIEAIEAIRSVCPTARFLSPEPIINIVPESNRPKTWRRVESDNLLQYQAWDMLTGRVWPRLGGDPKYLDIVGVNFYSDNQFTLGGETILRGDTRYKPLAQMLVDVHQRYGRPMLISETGCEGDSRARWLRYVCDEAAAAMRVGAELHGVTIYPVLDHPGWVDDRHCANGLWGYCDETGHREEHLPLAVEIQAQTPKLLRERERVLGLGPRRPKPA